MKLLKNSVFLSLLLSLFVQPLLGAEDVDRAVGMAGNGRDGIVVAEDPDGGLIIRRGTSREIRVGDRLFTGDVIKSLEATVIVSICDGSLITIYPESEVVVTELGDGYGFLHLVEGELLGDTMSDCRISIGNVAGTADISNGVYGVLLIESGEGWTLQIRNLDGTVTFTGADNLDISNATASIVEPGKTLNIPAGEEMIIRGIYDLDTDIFALLGGPALAALGEETVGQLQSASEFMSSIEVPNRPDELPGEGAEDIPGLEKAEDKTEGKPSEETVIDVPWYDIETASDKG